MAQVVFEIVNPAGNAGLAEQLVIAPPVFVGVCVVIGNSALKV
jgi:hypothetical protein